MGIKNFNKFLREKSPNVFEKIHLSEYAFKKVAIDISLYLFKFKAIFADKWLSAFINLISSLRRNEIHCVFIYDGKAPPEKDLEREKRKADKEKLQKQVYDLQQALDHYHQTGFVENILQELYNKGKHSPSNKRLLGEQSTKSSIDMNWVEEKIQQKSKQIIDICAEDFEFTKNLFDILNVPYYTAPTEAEKMCSKLCIDGIVDAVLSEDTDVIAYGTPSFLSKIDTRTDVCVKITNTSMLKELNFDSQEQLLDLCIMIGTDYNDNIFKVGPHTAYKQIITHKNIETLEKNGLDVTILKHKRVRELFTQFDDYGITSIPYCGYPDFERLKQFNSQHKLDINIEKLVKDFTRDIVFEDSDSENIEYVIESDEEEIKIEKEETKI
jgi:5'-3' exonuclease